MEHITLDGVIDKKKKRRKNMINNSKEMIFQTIVQLSQQEMMSKGTEREEAIEKAYQAVDNIMNKARILAEKYDLQQ
jgi:hypothetical protein